MDFPNAYPIPLKGKYRIQRSNTGGKYRGRTGPNCCTKNCATARWFKDKLGHGRISSKLKSFA